MENINIDEIPLLDCRYKENNKILIKLFNNMKPVKNKNLSYKDDFKNDLMKEFAKILWMLRQSEEEK